MLKNTLFALACIAGMIGVVPTPLSAQADLDKFMERVLARRDDNWKKLQQYVLEEKEGFDLVGPGGLQLWGFRRDYQWFIKQGVFIRSPLRANGVTVSEADRRKAEDEFLKREQQRERRRQRREARAKAAKEGKPWPPEEEEKTAISIGPTGVKVTTDDKTSAADQPSNVQDILREGAEPQFVSAAYFMKFRFESGHYALVGRDKIDDKTVLKIEYYPREGLFKDDRSKPNQKEKEEDEKLQAQMNKASMVTLWVDQASFQILQYTFDNIDMDFLPGRELARVTDLKATMRMGQMFPSIWLPKSIEMHFGMLFALGTVDGTYHVDYHDYKEASVAYKIK